MADEVVQGFETPNTHSSDYNSLSFIIQQAIKDQVNTAIVCKVVAVSDAHVDVLPLVSQVDGMGQMVEPTTLFHLPFMRYHGGICAVKLNPVVGDIGLAIFTQKDCSNVGVGQSEPQKPASNRTMSMANGFYIGGFLNSEPSTFIELKQDGSIDITAPSGININGNISVNGSVTSTGDVVGGGISLTSHVHGGVTSGGSTTSTPQ